MNVAEAVGRTLVRQGIGTVFGVVGSGNFAVTNAMVAAGARYVAARHENGAATMADAFARMSTGVGGGVSAVTVHQGCGLTNAMTGLTEAAKSRTPLVVVAAEATQPRSNFYVDQAALAEAVGALPMRVDSAAAAVATAAAAVQRAVGDRRTVLLNLPLDVQVLEAPEAGNTGLSVQKVAEVPDQVGVETLAEALQKARRPVFVAGRGARGPGCRAALEALADRCGALLATSAVAKGLFAGNPWSLDVSGGFSSPLAADMIRGADLIVGWGCTLNMWTMRHGTLIAPDATVVQVDIDADALGSQRRLSFGVVGDVRQVAEALAGIVPEQPGYRSGQVRVELGQGVRWQDSAFEPVIEPGRIDPRELTMVLDRLLPEERIVAVDSGNFMGYPSMFLDVPDEFGFCFTQAFQSVGLGLATAIGAALARPDRLPVAALGDGGAFMGASELETVVRLGLPMLVVVYDDAAYGAEVHHFGPDGAPLDTVCFPDVDLAAIARGYGFEALTAREPHDLEPVADWVAGPRTAPMLVDAKVTRGQPSWWLEEAFRGH